MKGLIYARRGGSAQTVVRSQLINKASDGNGYIERIVPDFLYFGKSITNDRDKDIVITNSDLGDLAKKVADVILDTEIKTNTLSTKIESFAKFPTKMLSSVANANSIVDSGVYYIISSATGSPSAHSYVLFHINYNEAVYLQFAISITGTVSSKKRSYNVSSKTWSSWYEFDGTQLS